MEEGREWSWKGRNIRKKLFMATEEKRNEVFMK